MGDETTPEEPEAEAAASGLEMLLEFIRVARGFDFTGYKRTSLARRIRKRMGEGGDPRLDRLPRPPRDRRRRVPGAVQHHPDQRHELLPRR